MARVLNLILFYLLGVSEIENNILAMIGAFISIAIMLGISTQILGGTVSDCSSLPGYNATEANSTGWAKQCYENNNATMSAFTLLVIVLIVVAAAVILTVVRML